MPIPTSTNKGKVMEAIKKHHPSWSKEKKVAVMLNQARKAGAHIPERSDKMENMKRRFKNA